MYHRHRDTPTLDTPCVRNCCLDQDDVCMGCGRLLTDIQRWHSASIEQRREILLAAAQRREQRAHRR